VVVGDFNAKSSTWGSEVTDAKGEALEAFAASLGIWSYNMGNTPTFVREASVSIIDVTFSGPDPIVVHNWRILNEYSTSDHQYVAFDVSAQDEDAEAPHPPAGPKWAFRKLDRDALLGKIMEDASRFAVAASAELRAERPNDLLDGVCNASMARLSDSRRGRRGAHWWNDDIAARRRACIAAMSYQRSAMRRGMENSHQERVAFREARKALRFTIRSAQERCWHKLCAAVDNDP